MRLKLQHLPEPVAARLRRFHVTRQLRRGARWGLGTLALYGLMVLLAVQLDRFLFLETGFRIAVWWVVHGLVAAVGVTGLAALAFRRHTPRDVAYDFEASVQQNAEEHYVTLDHVMRNAEAGGSDTHQQLVAQLTRGAVRHAQQPLKMIPARDRLLRGFSLVILATAMVMAGLWAVPGYRFGLMLHRFYRPDVALPKPSFLQLVVSPTEPVVGKGEELALQVTVKGHLPAFFDWLYRKAGHSASRCVMSMAAGRPESFRFDAGARVELSRVQRDLFLYSKADMVSNFCFVVRCGDAQTAVQKVEVISQPVVTDVSLEVVPPDYSGLPKQTLTNLSSSLQFLSGSKIAVTFRTDQPVPKREVRFEKVPRPQAHTWDESLRTGRFEFTLKKRVAFEIVVQNRHGFANRERVRGVINLREDLPPTVQLDDPPADVEKVSGEIVTFRAGISDDLGIREMAVRYLLNPDPDEEMPMKELPVPVGTHAITATNLVVDFDLERVGAAPGDVVLLQLRARDTAGNDGVSRETRVRVLPFTRDENERLRLRALYFLQEVLNANADAGLPPFSGGEVPAAPMSDKAVEAVKAAARKAGVAYADGATWRPVFDLLEREHHFTDRPRHKDDVRMLRAILWRTVGTTAAKGNAPANDSRAGELRRLSAAILPGLCHLRQAKNLTWRLFGMRQETERIASDLNREIDPQSPAARSFERRLQIYLNAIQDLGEEITQLNQAGKWVDPEVMKRQVGTMNTAAYSVKRGSTARRRAACRQVAEALTAMLDGFRPAYAGLLKDEAASRSRLVALYRGCLNGYVMPAADLTKVGGDEAAAWLAEDARLMAFNPFLSLWPRCVNLALLNGVEEVVAGTEAAPSKSGESARRKKAAALLDPMTAADLIERDRRGMQRAAFEWENRMALAEPIGTSEKILQLSLSEMEESAANGEDWSWAEGRLARLAGLTNADESVIASLDFRDAGGAAGSQAVPDPSLIPEWVRSQGILLSPPLQVQRLQEQFGGDTTSLAALLRAGEGMSAAAGVRVADLLARENRLLAELATLLELTLRVAGPEQEPGRLEWLLVAVREQRHRFAVTTRPFIAVLRKASDARAGEGGINAMTAELDKGPALREPLGKAIESWKGVLEGDGKLDQADKAKYPILENYDRSRDLYRVLVQMRAPEAKPGELSKMMRERYPDLALGYLAEGIRYAEAAGESVRRAEVVLRQDPAGLAEAVARLGACRGSLAQLRQHVERSGTGDAQARVGRAADDLLRQLDTLKTDGARADAEAVSRLIFILGEVSKGLAALSNDLKSAAQAATQGFTLNGGPDGIWEPATRLSAERSQRRLVRQTELAVRLGNQGVLEAGTAAGTALLANATAWAAEAFAVDRSELNPSEGIRLGGSGGDEQANPLVKYLRDEIQKARQMPGLKHGAEQVRQYLDALNDYLRY